MNGPVPVAAPASGSLAASATPTRDHDEENFPTASLLLAKPLRAKVMAFYRFVRVADDIGDSPVLAPEEKIRRLDAMERALDDPATTVPEAAAMHRAQVGLEEARLMLSAFRQDAVKHRYAGWDDLVDYCRRSADPVGRMLLRLHGDGANGPANAAADALCTALQVLNHLQDLVPDRQALDRIYLPEPWMAIAGGEAAFFDPANGTRRREVLDSALDRVEEQLDRAAILPRLLKSRRLAVQSAMTIGCARRLVARLRKGDPVLGRVALTKADFAAALAEGIRLGPRDAAVVAARVSRAGSSFARGMAALRGERRRALWAVYAFCRAVDDIADGAMPEVEKRRFLRDWRGKLAAPDCALSRELAWAREAYGVPLGECEAMIAGMETDSADRLRLETEADLDLYCRRVAGSVGAMSVRIFGAPEAEGFGLALGHTFQLTNILRDVDEDALRERVYIPRDLLAAEGIPDGPAQAIVAHPRFAAICERLGVRAREGFAAAERDIRAYDPKALLPAAVMMWGYRRLLDRLLARGWEKRGDRPRLAKGEKLRMAWMALGFGRAG
ncbi:squalene/phytoene synthase family protein [Paracraurococcus lichenis]|uniref:Squalene/phytoene synthase family protein n=1 Tax=Paracraurococcus lichenis TaxID=3064888 RepID=A0ABT9DUL0_9PROT|nr:squalene/phytoene synthase family protein [Paracraurococcus sp. LOR1-02]MDO9707586.1 squalene/phytoene synthase family protein [Paracraurococcus sp. LOR1-02]